MAIGFMIYQLLSDPEITNLGTRIYPLVVPINQRDKYEDAECTVTYQIIDDQPVDDVYTSAKVESVRVQLNCQGNKYAHADAVMVAIRDRIDNKRAFTLDGTTVQVVYLIDKRDHFNEKGEVVGISHDYIFKIVR